MINIDAPRTWSRLREVDPGTSLGLGRGECAVCIPVYGGFALFTECLHSVLRHTPESALLVIADDASPDEGPARMLRELDAAGQLGRDIVYTRQVSNLGFVGNMNSVMEMTAPADIVVLNSDCVVSEGWFDCLREAAYSDTTVGTASTLTNNGTILSVPDRNRPALQLPQDWTLDQAAAAVRSASPRLRPRIPTAIGHCMYIRRTALELVGVFDTTFSPGYGEEVDFSQRCTARGLSHVAADDVLVWHHGRGSFGARPEILRVQADHDRIIDSRYPHYAREVEALSNDQVGPLSRSLGAARRALLGLSVTIDASCLTNATAVQGTQLHALELIRALWEQRGTRLRVVVPRRCNREFSDFLRGLSGLEKIFVDEVREDTERSDIVHRPFQVSYMHELVPLKRLGDRLVVTQQDLIAYRNPSYFRSFGEWTHYRQSIRASLALADAVVFFSKHAAHDAVLEGLAEERRVRVVNIGIDHHFGGDGSPRPPREAERLAGHPMLLCIGADFHHKNRVFALRVLEQLQRRHGWQGRLALVGPKAWCGSSSPEEAAFLLRHPDVDAATVRLPAVGEDEKLWLMQHASAVLYPTVYEGFGLVPFEAAALDVPCIFASQASLAEVLPEETALIVPWDEAATADRTMEVLQDPETRRRLVADVLAAGQTYRWRQTATELVSVYRDALEGPPSWRLSPDLVDPGMTLLGRHLVGTEGVLSEEVQHVLWAIGRRRPLAGPFFGALTGFHTAGRALLRRRAALRRRRRTAGD